MVSKEHCAFQMKNDNAMNNTHKRFVLDSENQFNIDDIDLKSSSADVAVKNNKEKENLSVGDEHGPSPAKRPRLKSSNNNSSSHHRLVLENLWADDQNVREQNQPANRGFVVPDSPRNDLVLDTFDLTDENESSILTNFNGGEWNIIHSLDKKKGDRFLCIQLAIEMLDNQLTNENFFLTGFSLVAEEPISIKNKDTSMQQGAHHDTVVSQYFFKSPSTSTTACSISNPIFGQSASQPRLTSSRITVNSW
jgi:hypothetical protein